MQEHHLPVENNNCDERSLQYIEHPSWEANPYEMSSHHAQARTPLTLQGNFVTDNSNYELPFTAMSNNNLSKGFNHEISSYQHTLQSTQQEPMISVINSQPNEHEVYAEDISNQFAEPLHYANTMMTSRQVNNNLSNTSLDNNQYNSTRFNPLMYKIPSSAPLCQQSSDEAQITQQQLSHSHSNTYSERVTARPLRRSNSKVSFILNDS